MKFKIWFYKESLAGPGGGPEPHSEKMDKLALNHHAKGIGAFPAYNNELPPKTGKSPVKDYISEKKMKK